MPNRFNVVNSPHITRLLSELRIPQADHAKLRYSSLASPASIISIIRQDPLSNTPVISDAMWWLRLDSSTLRPVPRFVSYYTRSESLHSVKSLAYFPYRNSRCIVPASSFMEGAGDARLYHKIHFEDSAIAFGGIYREWVHKETGEMMLSVSIITLPAGPEWELLHPKDMPLMLPNDPELRAAWLDPEQKDVSQFDILLKLGLEQPRVVTPVCQLSSWNATGPAVKVTAG